MKLFETTLKNFALMGIGSSEGRINRKMLIAMLFLWLTSIFNSTYLIHGADNFKDYTQNLYMTVASTEIAMFYVQIVLQISTVEKFIAEFEKNLDESEQIESQILKSFSLNIKNICFRAKESIAKTTL